MDYSKTPLWMQDDLVKDIPREKLDFLSKLFAQGHGKTQKEMMALLMPAMRKAKQEHLTFTPQKMQAAAGREADSFRFCQDNRQAKGYRLSD